VFCAPPRKFKILTILDLLGPRKLYNLGFTKKHYDHKDCTKSMFDRLFEHYLENLKY
ncbi:hypothetical protein MUK42_32625, partial [Musa troglodytarum]